MAGQPIPLNNNDIVEVRIVQDMSGQRLLNVLHYRASMTTGAAEFPTVVAAMDAVMKSTSGVSRRLQAMQLEQLVNVRIDYQIVSPPRFAVLTTLGVGPGTIDNAEVLGVPNTAIVITKRGIVAKKGGAGSVHVGGIDPRDIQDGVISQAIAGKMALLGTALAAVIPAGTGINMIPIIFNRTTPLLSQEVSTTSGQFTSRVMRRRTRGVGV